MYITNANKAVADMKSPPSLLELQKDAISAGPLARNGGGGAYNHDLFWAEMCAPKAVSYTHLTLPTICSV